MRTTKHIRRAGMALLAVAALTLSGCSNSGDSNSDSGSSSSSSLGSFLARTTPKVDREELQDQIWNTPHDHHQSSFFMERCERSWQ